MHSHRPDPDDPNIHPAAVVDPRAQIGADTVVGPFAVIGPNVKIGRNGHIYPHTVVDGYTTLGDGVQVFPGAAVGLPPQDLKYDGSPTKLVVGDRTIIRECATLQPGSVGDGCGLTSVGSDCLIMAYCHIAHDCVVGDRVIMANATQVAGHCVIEDFAILGGATTVHQFVRIGTRAITGAATRVQMDIPPYMMADGHPASLFGLNKVGLARAGFSEDLRSELKKAYVRIFVRGPFATAVAELEAEETSPEVADLCRFIRASSRGVTRVRKKLR